MMANILITVSKGSVGSLDAGGVVEGTEQLQYTPPSTAGMQHYRPRNWESVKDAFY